MMRERRLVISTVGISLLNAHMPSDIRQKYPKFLNEQANARTLSPENMAIVERISQEVQKTLQSGDISKIRRVSAELNGIYALYENQLALASQDMHYLIATDTVLGKHCAELVENHLRAQGITVNTYIPPSLTTATTEDFEEGCKELIKWCYETIPGYRADYTVVFNLVAAFKSLQGYLNTIGMFYADDMLYLFEGNDQPIFIPRLPIKIDLDAIKPFAVPIALMAEGKIDLPAKKVQGLSRAMYHTIDERVLLSDWGLLIWGQIRDDLLGNELLSFPHLHYENSFRNDFDRTKDAKQKILLQKTLAKVAALLEKHKGDRTPLRGDGGILYETYRNRDLDHFRLSDDMRVNCKPKDGKLLLLNFGTHDYCEKDRLR